MCCFNNSIVSPHDQHCCQFYLLYQNSHSSLTLMQLCTHTHTHAESYFLNAAAHPFCHVWVRLMSLLPPFIGRRKGIKGRAGKDGQREEEGEGWKGKASFEYKWADTHKACPPPLLPSPLSPDQCLSHTLLLSFTRFCPLSRSPPCLLTEPSSVQEGCWRHNLLVITAYWNELIERKGECVAVCLCRGSGNTVTATAAAALTLHRGAGESREKTERHQQPSGRFSHLFNHHLIWHGYWIGFPSHSNQQLWLQGVR